MGVKVMHGFPLDDGGERVSLTHAEKAQIAARSRRGLGLVVLSQAFSGFVVSLLVFAFGGWAAGLSALCGSLCYVMPSVLLVVRLMLSTFRANGADPFVFLLGNALKVVVAIALLWGLSELDSGWVNWLAVVAGLIATLKGYWIVVLLTGGWAAKKI